jgi:hypothetical protein
MEFALSNRAMGAHARAPKSKKIRAFAEARARMKGWIVQSIGRMTT